MRIQTTKYEKRNITRMRLFVPWHLWTAAVWCQVEIVNSKKLDKTQRCQPSSSLLHQKTPSNKQKKNVSGINKTTSSSPSLLYQNPLNKTPNTESVQTETNTSNIDVDKVKKPQSTKSTNTNEKSSISLSLLENKWVTDDTIQLYYDTLTSLITKSDKTILLMNTVVTHAIKCLQDYDHLLEPLQLFNKNYVLFPIHDLKQDVQDNYPENTQCSYKTEGSHWSLMLFVRNLQKFLYFDSCGTYNREHAQKVAEKVHEHLGVEGDVLFQIVEVPQQPNTVDCGIYLTIFTDILTGIQLIGCGSLDPLGNTGSRLVCTIRHSDILTKRSQLALLWHNYPHLLLNCQTVSDMMFKHFVSTSTGPQAQVGNIVVSANTKPVTLISESDSNMTTYQVKETQPKNPWQFERRSKRYKLKPKHKIFAERETAISTSNSFHVLTEKNNLLQIKESNKNKNYVYKTNTTSKKRTNHVHEYRHDSNYELSIDKIKVELYADSQGKGLPEIIGSCSKGKIYVGGVVKSGADVQQVYNQAAKSLQRPIIILAGTNDILKGSPQVIYKKMENELQILSRHDVHHDNSIHYDLALTNSYIREIVLRMDNVHLIDLDSFQRYHFTRQGLHLNYKGKRKLGFMIVDFVNSVNGKKHEVDQENWATGPRKVFSHPPNSSSESKGGTWTNSVTDESPVPEVNTPSSSQVKCREQNESIASDRVSLVNVTSDNNQCPLEHSVGVSVSCHFLEGERSLIVEI
ncbi:SUMO1 sentrin specific peptidase 8 [Homalodisca vitripennis]|nr:SUMO1 sentrin specific peptidase 8 [Homalodisca vitripennis]